MCNKKLINHLLIKLRYAFRLSLNCTLILQFLNTDVLDSVTWLILLNVTVCVEKIQSEQFRVQLVIALLNQETLLKRENSVASGLILISCLSFSFLSKLCKNKICFLPQGARNLAVGELKLVYKCMFSFSGDSYALHGNYSEHKLPFL